MESPAVREFSDTVTRPEEVAKLPAEYRELLVRVLGLEPPAQVERKHR